MILFQQKLSRAIQSNTGSKVQYCPGISHHNGRYRHARLLQAVVEWGVVDHPYSTIATGR